MGVDGESGVPLLLVLNAEPGVSGVAGVFGVLSAESAAYDLRRSAAEAAAEDDGVLTAALRLSSKSSASSSSSSSSSADSSDCTSRSSRSDSSGDDGM